MPGWERHLGAGSSVGKRPGGDAAKTGRPSRTHPRREVPGQWCDQKAGS